jgi:hypothetical protein
MKYEIGQTVRLKDDDSVYKPEYIEDVKKFNYIATVKDRTDAFGSGWYYKFAGHDKWWNDICIEGLYVEPIDPKELIEDRFEILDL